MNKFKPASVSAFGLLGVLFLATICFAKPREAFTETDNLKWDLRTAPIAILAHRYLLEGSFRPSPQWATGPSVIRYDCHGPSGLLARCISGWSVGWQTTYYFQSPNFNTWYASAHAYSDRHSARSDGAEMSESASTGLKVNAVIGHQWQLKSIFFLLGCGVEHESYKIERKWMNESFEDSQNQWRPLIEANIGFAF